MSSEMADFITPADEPTMNSVEPPPMSITSTGLASALTPLSAPVNDSRASASPLITSGSTPSRDLMPSEELVPVPRVPGRRGGDEVDLVGRYAGVLDQLRVRSTTANVRLSASGWNSPVASTPWPSRTISVCRSRSTKPPSGLDSAISRRSELVPQSTAATPS